MHYLINRKAILILVKYNSCVWNSKYKMNYINLILNDTTNQLDCCNIYIYFYY